MEFWKPNFLETTSAMVVGSNTTLAEYLMTPDPTFQYVTSGFNDDNTTASVRVNFDQTMQVSRIAFRGGNLREFKFFYNGVTANTFALTSTGATVASSWTANSETGMVLQATPTYCTSVTLDMKKTMVANAEKAVGYLVLTAERLTFSRLPAAKNYLPLLEGQEVMHELSTGDVRIQTISDKWRFDIKLDYISETFRNELRAVYDVHDSHIFVPFGTTTAWDNIIAPVVWPKPFGFYRYSDNAVATGFEGSIKLFETSPF